MAGAHPEPPVAGSEVETWLGSLDRQRPASATPI